MARSLFGDDSRFLHYILYADAVLVTFFLARVVIHEFGEEIMLPLVAAAGVMLILLDNRRCARAVARMAVRMNPDITRHRMYETLLRLYGEGIHWVIGAVLVGTAVYSFLLF